MCYNKYTAIYLKFIGNQRYVIIQHILKMCLNEEKGTPSELKPIAHHKAGAPLAGV